VRVGFQPPIDVPAPKPGEVKAVAQGPPPKAASDVPPVTALPVPAVSPEPLAVKPVEVGLPKSADLAPPKIIELPMPTTPAVKPTAAVPAVPGVAVETPPPPAVEVSLPVPAVTPATAAVPAKPPELPPRAAPAVDPVPLPTPAKPEPPAPPRLDPPASPTGTPAKSPQAPESVVAGSVRVVLKLGAGQPRFEVLAGEDTLLKVVSDRVDVRSPSEKGETMSALKAAGAVRFSAPGCEGTCQELTVLPGSGDVDLSGDVRVRCKQGKGETEIVASRMTFKLGSAPAYAVPEPATVNTSFTDPVRR
jgi:hypothetical protein